eukprot:SAG11_NODE_8782_length_977_cov_1.082005_2_plen_160_part_00
MIARDSPMYVDLPFDARWHFTATERRWHITMKETSVPLPGIKALQVQLIAKGLSPLKNLVWLNRTDNQVGDSYVTKQGGKKLHLAQLTKDLWEWCLASQILPMSEYMPGDDMVLKGADLQSRELYTPMEWKINSPRQIFCTLTTSTLLVNCERRSTKLD